MIYYSVNPLLLHFTLSSLVLYYGYEFTSIVSFHIFFNFMYIYTYNIYIRDINISSSVFHISSSVLYYGRGIIFSFLVMRKLVRAEVGIHHHQFSSVAQSCPTLCDPMNRSTPGLPVHHHLPEFTQTRVYRVRDAIQPSHPLSSPSPPVPNPCQHQSLFQ